MVTYRDRRKVVRVDLDHRHVSRRIAARDFRGEDTIVEQPHRHTISIRDDVIVREDVAILADDEAGPTRLTRLIGLRIELPEEVFDPARKSLLLSALPRVRARAREALGLNGNDSGGNVIRDRFERVLRLEQRLHLLQRRLWRRLGLRPTRVYQVRARCEDKAP